MGIGNSKKGSLLDVLFIGIALLVFGLGVLFAFRIYSGFDAQIQGMDVFPDEAKTASTAMVGHFSGILDKSMLFLAIGLAVVTLILATMVVVHPVFIFLYFIGLLIVIFLCGIFSNLYQEIAASSEMLAYASQLTMITNVLYYLPFFVGVFGILLMIVMYKASQGGGY
jgi:hypothetical protein